MLDYAEPVTKLIDEFKRLPSIGQKSAQRLAFYILRAPEGEVERLIEALREVKQRITECSICNNLTDINPCRFCSLPSRDHSLNIKSARKFHCAKPRFRFDNRIESSNASIVTVILFECKAGIVARIPKEAPS